MTVLKEHSYSPVSLNLSTNSEKESMSKFDDVMLSVVIISHNQREVLRRCIESVLGQKTTFSVEVIVSDDRSSDGTREMLTDEYKDRVITTFCNSDQCNPTFTLERASFNRLNGLKYATGKYLINIDGDDFYTSTDLFQTMVDTLEAHPECTLCCQNYCVVNSNDIDAPHIPQNKSEMLQSDGIITGKELFLKVRYLHASCFLVRNVKTFTKSDMMGIPYDDNTIVARYIGDGNVAVLNRCDFVYVQYGNSTCATMTEEDKAIIFLPEFYILKLAPSFAGVLMQRNLGAFSYVSRKAIKKELISKELQSFFCECNIFILNKLTNHIRCGDWLRYCAIYWWTSIMFGLHLKHPLFYRVLYRLAIGKISKEVKF